MNITQQDISNRLKVANGYFSDILNGKSEVGKATAKKFAEFTGACWVDFLTMAPDEIRAALFSAAEKQIEKAA